jgi:hypothetical protein
MTVKAPSGCAECGYLRRQHYFTHPFAAPGSELVWARMLKRRALRQHPELAWLSPDAAVVLGHDLRTAGVTSSLPGRRRPPERWYCPCGQYAVRVDGIEAGGACRHRCTALAAIPTEPNQEGIHPMTVDSTVERCHYACGAHHGVDNHPPECDPGSAPDGAEVCGPCGRDLAAGAAALYEDEVLAREIAVHTFVLSTRAVHRGELEKLIRGNRHVAAFDDDRRRALQDRVEALLAKANVTIAVSWDDQPDQTPEVLLADARAVALLCRDILAELPGNLESLFGQAWTELPDWFTEGNNNRALWGAEGERTP